MQWKPLVTFLLCLPLFAGGCSSHTPSTTVVIGSKNFTEQFILAEIMAQLIEARTDLTVKRVTNLGGTMICHKALTEGEIDIYPEYTGTALTAILKEKPVTDPQQAFNRVADAYRTRYAVQWLPPFGFNNTYAITVRQSDAKNHHWQKISDLEPEAPTLRAGFTAEFVARSDGYPGLKRAYKFHFGSIHDMDPGLMYKAIAKREVDVICAFSTDGRIAAYNLQPLTDDRSFFPPYFAAPLVRSETLRRHPEIKTVLAALAGKIDNTAMQQLNYAVDEKKQAVRTVAHNFLLGAGLVPNNTNR
jgi:glycine betaine/choline ABC-type transport system substrate-binding protein